MKWLLNRIKARWTCHKLGHDYQFDSPSFTGHWIRCTRCKKLEEYIGGAHEPKGYSE